MRRRVHSTKSVIVAAALVVASAACSSDSPERTAPQSAADSAERPEAEGGHSSLVSLALDTVWSTGGPEDKDAMAFGVLADATLDAQLNVYLLDRATLNVHVLSRSGGYSRSIGRSGRGPGELSNPLALQHDGGHTLFVLDEMNGLLIIDTDAADLRTSRSIRLPFPATDFCLMNERIIVYGSHRGHTVHELSASGDVLRSFGEYQGPSEHPRHQPAYNNYGKIACFPDADVVVTTTRFFPVVSAYQFATATLLWSDSLPGFVPYGVVTTPEFYSIGQHQSGSDKQYVLRPLSISHVIAQSIRETDANELIKTCVYSLANGTCDVHSTTLPALVAFRDGYAVSVTESDYWYAALWKLQLLQ